MPIRDLNKGGRKEHYLEDQEIVAKEFGEVMHTNYGQDKNTFTWSMRQNEWYNAERRFIFACKNDQERKKWMTAIKLAVADHRE
jgi:hypothetical protein